MRAYSLDLRQRILQAVLRGDLTQAELAERFSVSLSFTEKLLPRYRATGSLAPRPHGGGRQRCLRPADEPMLVALLEADNDATDAQIAARFRSATGHSVSTRTAGRMWRRLGLTRKKDAPGQRAEPA